MLKNVILLGRKSGVYKAEAWLKDQGIRVKHFIHEQAQDLSVIDMNATDVDLVISYLYWKKIYTPLINLGRYGCINFHPAPLPDYKGRAGYNTAILEQRSTYGVSVHYITSEELDAGPIIEVQHFAMDHEYETELSLEKKSQFQLLKLFKKTINRIQKDYVLGTIENHGGVYWSKSRLEQEKNIHPNGSLETIDRKIRAFYYPPYSGATIQLHGKAYTVISKNILEQIAKKL